MDRFLSEKVEFSEGYIPTYIISKTSLSHRLVTDKYKILFFQG